LIDLAQRAYHLGFVRAQEFSARDGRGMFGIGVSNLKDV
jgi:hypothetical protein